MVQILPNQTGLYVQLPKAQPVAFPLKHTDVQATITGNVSRVKVAQTFENPFTTTLEAIYTFPLPDEAAVDEMEIRIGDRIIKGNIKQRQEAQAIYEAAKRQGQTAGLLEQERDNIFTQSLANIKPGEQIDVIISYTDSLKFEGGNYEFVFPMVVGPRYIPGVPIAEQASPFGSAPAPMTLNQDTDQVPDASRLNAPILPAGMRSGHDIQVTVTIDAGIEIKTVQSPSHQLQIQTQGRQVQVKLLAGDTIPNKDLILRYQVAGDRTQSTVLTQSDDRGGHFALYLIPAIQYPPNQLVAKDMVFLIDTSGSQMGEPLKQCQTLMRHFIQGLNPDDTFTIVDFSDTTRQLSPIPLANTAQNRQLALQYVNQLTANGGTEMLRGIQTVLNYPVVDPGRLRNIVLLTDGYIGNENQILAAVQRHLKPGNRLYSFGAGSSVNRFLLNRIAELGRGVSYILRHDESATPIVEKFFRQINQPVLVNLQVQWQGTGEPPILYPAAPPDLFAEQPLVLFGRKSDRQAGTLQVRGTMAGGYPYQQSFDLEFTGSGSPAIAQLWGRARIKELMNQMVSGETKRGVETVTETALAYQLLSQYTAFVAVSDEVRVKPEETTVSVQVPVEMPEGLSYDGIFGSLPPLAVPAPASSPAMGGFVAGSSAAMMPQSAAKKSARHGRGPAPGAPAPRMVPPPEPIVPPELSKAEEAAPAWDQDETPTGAFFQEATVDAAFDDLESFLAEPELSNRSFARRERSQKGFSDRLQIASVTELDLEQTLLLLQHLQQIVLPPECQGNLVFELEVSQGRVRQVILDEADSSIADPEVLDRFRRSLLSWKPAPGLKGKIRLHLVLS